MDSTRRLELYSYNLEQALANNEKLVLFGDIQSGRFVNIAISAQEQTLNIDIPVRNLSSLETKWLDQDMEIVTDSDGKTISYQKKIPTTLIKYAADYTEWIFTNIFQLPEFFSVTRIFT